MENKKGNKKQKIVLILLLLVVLCCGGVAGVTLFNQRQNDQVATEEPDKKDETTEVGKVSSNRYTVIVKSDTGVVLPNVLVSIYDTEGNMLTVPEATDTAGRLIYTAEQKGTYGARVMAAPFQYALDTEVYYFETGTNVLSIVLKEDPAAYVARIGETYYTLRGAISAANASTTDVTIAKCSIYDGVFRNIVCGL